MWQLCKKSVHVQLHVSVLINVTLTLNKLLFKQRCCFWLTQQQETENNDLKITLKMFFWMIQAHLHSTSVNLSVINWCLQNTRVRQVQEYNLFKNGKHSINQPVFYRGLFIAIRKNICANIRYILKIFNNVTCCACTIK